MKEISEPRTVLNPMRFWVATQNKYFKGKITGSFIPFKNSNL